MNTRSTALKFRKMHGLGNDFVIIDARENDPQLSTELVARIGDRHFGIGFDQLATFHKDEEADARIEFWNSDGSRAGACGNATRCIADLLMREARRDELALKTERGVLIAERADDLIRVNMGEPQFNWRDIPLARDVDIDALPLDGAPMAVGMGNPHCVFFVDDAEAVALEEEGRRFEHDPLYPERTNVEFISLLGEDHLRMRVWERGGMMTLACGSGACAAGVAAHRRGLTGRKVKITLDGGDIFIDWRDDGVWMSGPVAYIAEGEFDPRFLKSK